MLVEQSRGGPGGARSAAVLWPAAGLPPCVSFAYGSELDLRLRRLRFTSSPLSLARLWGFTPHEEEPRGGFTEISLEHNDPAMLDYAMRHNVGVLTPERHRRLAMERVILAILALARR